MGNSARALGVDFGQKRIGIAVSDGAGMLATAYDTIERVGDRTIEHGRLLELVDETEAVVVVIGVPYSLDGEVGQAAKLVLSEIRGLEKRVRREERPMVIETQDERFSTVTASQALHAGGTNSKRQRKVIDATAAAVILQSWLDGRAE